MNYGVRELAVGILPDLVLFDKLEHSDTYRSALDNKLLIKHSAISVFLAKLLTFSVKVLQKRLPKQLNPLVQY